MNFSPGSLLSGILGWFGGDTGKSAAAAAKMAGQTRSLAATGEAAETGIGIFTRIQRALNQWSGEEYQGEALKLRTEQLTAYKSAYEGQIAGTPLNTSEYKRSIEAGRNALANAGESHWYNPGSWKWVQRLFSGSSEEPHTVIQGSDGSLPSGGPRTFSELGAGGSGSLFGDDSPNPGLPRSLASNYQGRGFR